MEIALMEILHGKLFCARQDCWFIK